MNKMNILASPKADRGNRLKATLEIFVKDTGTVIKDSIRNEHQRGMNIFRGMQDNILILKKLN